MTHRNQTMTTSKPESPACSGNSMEETYLLAMRCPVFRRRDSHSGSRTELENLYGDGKGKGTSGEPARPKVPMRHSGADCFVVAMKRGNARGAKGAGHRRWGASQLATGGAPILDGRRQPSRGGTSRMTRECHVRNLCEARGEIPRAYSATSLEKAERNSVR